MHLVVVALLLPLLLLFGIANWKQCQTKVSVSVSGMTKQQQQWQHRLPQWWQSFELAMSNFCLFFFLLRNQQHHWLECTWFRPMLRLWATAIIYVVMSASERDLKDGSLSPHSSSTSQKLTKSEKGSNLSSEEVRRRGSSSTSNRCHRHLFSS